MQDDRFFLFSPFPYFRLVILLGLWFGVLISQTPSWGQTNAQQTDKSNALALVTSESTDVELNLPDGPGVLIVIPSLGELVRRFTAILETATRLDLQTDSAENPASTGLNDGLAILGLLGPSGEMLEGVDLHRPAAILLRLGLGQVRGALLLPTTDRAAFRHYLDRLTITPEAATTAPAKTEPTNTAESTDTFVDPSFRLLDERGPLVTLTWSAQEQNYALLTFSDPNYCREPEVTHTLAWLSQNSLSKQAGTILTHIQFDKLPSTFAGLFYISAQQTTLKYKQKLDEAWSVQTATSYWTGQFLSEWGPRLLRECSHLNFILHLPDPAASARHCRLNMYLYPKSDSKLAQAMATVFDAEQAAVTPARVLSTEEPKAAQATKLHFFIGALRGQIGHFLLQNVVHLLQRVQKESTLQNRNQIIDHPVALDLMAEYLKRLQKNPESFSWTVWEEWEQNSPPDSRVALHRNLENAYQAWVAWPNHPATTVPSTPDQLTSSPLAQQWQTESLDTLAATIWHPKADQPAPASNSLVVVTNAYDTRCGLWQAETKRFLLQAGPVPVVPTNAFIYIDVNLHALRRSVPAQRFPEALTTVINYCLLPEESGRFQFAGTCNDARQLSWKLQFPVGLLIALANLGNSNNSIHVEL